MPKRFFCEVKNELIMKICEHIKDQKNRSLMCQEDSSECRTAQFILESIFDKMEIYYYKEYVTSPSFAYSSDSEGDIDAEYGDEKEGLSKQDFILKKRGDKVREKLVNHRTLFSKVFPNYTNTPAQPDQRSISDVVDTMIYQALLLRKDTPYATLQRAVVYFSTLLDEESALEAHIQKRSNMMKLVIEFCEISRRNVDHLEAGNDVLRHLRELMQGTSTTVVIREIDNILENKIEPTPNVFTRLVRQCNASLPLPSPLRGGYSEDNKQSVLLSPTKENNKVEAQTTLRTASILINEDDKGGFFENAKESVLLSPAKASKRVPKRACTAVETKPSVFSLEEYNAKRNKHLPYTQEEKDCLLEGVKRFGHGKWCAILEHYKDVFKVNGR